MHLLPLAITLAAHAAHAAEPYTFQAAPLDDPARITWSTVHTACANAGARADDATLQPLRDACEAWSTLGDA
ncbi:MAG TPA: hypothetical protein PKA64_23100, partial [Myxococcota bacterium]|nr:hypothetical protein [Myxococcota bacterium]